MSNLIQIKNKYGSIPVAARASVWYTVCSILQKGIALLSTPLFTRIMSTEDYGIYAIYQSYYSIFIIFASLNLFNSVYNNILTKYSDERERATSSMLGLCTTITIGLAVIVIFFRKLWLQIFGMPQILSVVMFVQVLFEPAIHFWMASQRFEFKYRGVVIVTLLNVLLSTGLGILFVLNTDAKGNARIFAYAGVQICIGGILYLISYIRGKCFFAKKFWKYSLKFNIPLIPHYLSYSVLNQADRLMINSMVGKSEAAIYTVAYNIAMLMQIVTQSISNSLGPYTYQSVKERKFSKLRKTASGLIVAIAIGCCVVMLFAPEILKVFASQEYMDAVYIMPAVVAATFFLFLYPLFSIIEFYFEKSEFITIASVIGAVLNVILNYICIPIFGYYVAGFTTLVCYMLFAIAHYYFYRRILIERSSEIEDIYDLKIIIVTSIGVILFTIICMMIYENMWIRYGLIMIFIAIIILNRRTIYKNLKLMRNKGE